MYMRAPNQPISRPSPPKNYSGSAFSPSGLFYNNSMPPPVRQSQKRSDISEDEYSRNYDKPLYDKPNATYDPPVSSQMREEVNNEERQDHNESNDSPVMSSDTRQAGSIFSSLIPSFAASGRFPFGHGIGGEEMLILGMMLLIFLSGNEKGEIDHELIMMLGLLLLAG